MDYERLIQLKNSEELYKGIILEIHPDYFHVLSDEGEHLKLTYKKDHKIGDVIYFFKEDRLAQDRPNAVIPIKSKMRYLSMVAAILLIVIMVNTSLLNVTYAVLSLDINPSVEMTLNRNGKVLQILSLNEEASALLSGINLKGKNYNIAIDEILKQAKTFGYSIDQRSVLIAVAPLKPDSDQMVEAIQKSISKYAETLNAEILVGDQEDYEEILEDQISLGRHLLSIEHPEHDDDIKNLEIHDLFERFDEDDHQKNESDIDKEDKDTEDNTSNVETSDFDFDSDNEHNEKIEQEDKDDHKVQKDDEKEDEDEDEDNAEEDDTEKDHDNQGSNNKDNKNHED